MIASMMFGSELHPGFRFRLGVPGGRTPRSLFTFLASRGPGLMGAEILFTDERAVPPDDPESNFRQVKETLVDPLGVLAPRVIRMRAEDPDLNSAAREYETHLAEPLDFLILGVGEDGHFASIFPGSALVHERTRRVVPVTDSPKPPSRRLTITPRVVGEAKKVVVVASGESKRDAVARALFGKGDAESCPARLLREHEWFLDPAAAAGLPEKPPAR